MDTRQVNSIFFAIYDSNDTKFTEQQTQTIQKLLVEELEKYAKSEAKKKEDVLKKINELR
jgi:hypothetical protein